MVKKKVKVKSTQLDSQPPKMWNRLIGWGWKDKTPDIEAIKDLGQRLRTWALLDTSYRIEDFLDEENVNSSSFHLWLAKFEDLQESNSFAKRRIASRRWKMAFLKTGDRDIFKLDMHMYDESWGKNVNEYWAALRKQDADQQGDIHVHIDAAPNSDKVLPKKGKEQV